MVSPGSRSPAETAETDDESPPPERGGREGRRAGVSGSDGSAGSPAGTDADQEAKARGIVLRKLTVRAHTRQELAKALTKREIEPDVADRVLDRMAAVGLIDDAQFAADWVESRQVRRQLSASALRQELRVRGVDPESISGALETVDASNEWAAAVALVERRRSAMASLPYEVQYRRLAGALGRRGFGSGLIARVLSEMLDR